MVLFSVCISLSTYTQVFDSLAPTELTVCFGMTLNPTIDVELNLQAGSFINLPSSFTGTLTPTEETAVRGLYN